MARARAREKALAVDAFVAVVAARTSMREYWIVVGIGQLAPLRAADQARSAHAVPA